MAEIPRIGVCLRTGSRLASWQNTNPSVVLSMMMSRRITSGFSLRAASSPWLSE
jgi:hypothetical protein